MTSSTTSPSLTSTSKSCNSPPSTSPRHTRSCAYCVICAAPSHHFVLHRRQRVSLRSPSRVLRQLFIGVVLLQLGNLEQLQQVRAHPGLGLRRDGDVRHS